MPLLLERMRERIDAFHSRFNAAAAARGASALPPATATEDGADDLTCGGCGESISRKEAQWCGACRCAAYCDQECQRAGWKAGGHKTACKLLSRAKALPRADPDRSYVVQLKLEGREGLGDWAQLLEASGEEDVAGVHRQMAGALAPRERVLFALEARSHALLRFQMVPPTKRLEPRDLALFALQAVLEPATDVPTLNMHRESPHRPYAIWIPGPDDYGTYDIGGDGGLRSMARPVGRLLAGAGLPTSNWYVGGGYCAEAQLRPRLLSAGDDFLINTLVALDPDFYTDDEDKDEEGEDKQDGSSDEDGPASAAAPPRARPAAAAAAAPPPPLRVLVVAGMHWFGPVGESEHPLLSATATALRAAGATLEIAMYPMGRGGDGGGGGAGDRKAKEEALAARLRGGGFAACVVLGLGSGSDFKPGKPTYPWGNGPWRDALTGWVREAGGVVVLHGERAAAAVAREFFGLSWRMEGDHYRRTDHQLNRANPLLGSELLGRLPPAYNVKACMLNAVPPAERVYATAPGAVTHSLVPAMAGAHVDAGRAAMAAARCGGGAVAFFGDVNWEPATNAAVAALTQRLVAACRRRAGP